MVLYSFIICIHFVIIRSANLIKDLVKSNSLIKNKNSGGGSGGGGSLGGGFFDKMSKSPKKMLLTLILGIISLWLVTGFYKVNSDENALVLYFGKYHTIATPGLNYHIPYPVGRVVKQACLSHLRSRMIRQGSSWLMRK